MLQPIPVGAVREPPFPIFLRPLTFSHCEKSPSPATIPHERPLLSARSRLYPFRYSREAGIHPPQPGIP